MINKIDSNTLLYVVRHSLDESLTDNKIDFYKFAISLTDKLYDLCPHLETENFLITYCIALNTWIAWVLESKAIYHYGKAHPIFREYLLRQHLPELIKTVKDGMNIAVKEKNDEKRNGKIPSDITIPLIYEYHDLIEV